MLHNKKFRKQTAKKVRTCKENVNGKMAKDYNEMGAETDEMNRKDIRPRNSQGRRLWMLKTINP